MRSRIEDILGTIGARSIPLLEQPNRRKFEGEYAKGSFGNYKRRGFSHNVGAATITSTSFTPPSDAPDRVDNLYVANPSDIIWVAFRFTLLPITTLNVGGVGIYIDGVGINDLANFGPASRTGIASSLTNRDVVYSDPSAINNVSQLGVGVENGGGTTSETGGAAFYHKGFIPIRSTSTTPSPRG